MSNIAPRADADPGVSKGSTSRYATYVFIIMFAISFLNYMDRNVFSAAANAIGTQLHLRLDDIGFIAFGFTIVYTLGTLPLGIWADRAKRKDVVALCVSIWSLATAFTALANNFLSLFLSRMVLGIGEAGYFPAGTALMSDYFSRAQRSRIMSWWSVGQLVGILVGFGIGGVVAGLYLGSWRLAFIFTGIPGLLLAFLAWRLREPRRNEADEEAAALDPSSLLNEMTDTPHVVPVPSNIFAQLSSLLRIKTLVVLIVMQIFAFFSLGAAVAFLPTYLQQRDTLGLSSGFAGLLSGVVIVIGGGVGTIVGGYLADLLNHRNPNARVLVGGIGFLVCAPSFALAVTIHSLGIFLVFFFMTSALILLYTGPCTAATQDVVPSALRASSVAISLLLAHLLGDAFAPAIVGVLANAFDPTHGQHFANHVCAL
jgi:MFS family permease